uniref:Cl31697_1 n=1 Tax=Arundo donax TaxID=35708 RepID=A0A0A9CPD5_ARUDO
MGGTPPQLMLLLALLFSSSAVAPQVVRAVKPIPISNLRVGERDNSIRSIQKDIIHMINKHPNAGWTVDSCGESLLCKLYYCTI